MANVHYHSDWVDPILVDLCFNTVPVKMELDTRCISVNPQFEYSPLFLTEDRHHIVPVEEYWASHPCPGKGQNISKL